MSRHPMTTRRVLYEIPGMRSVEVHEAEFSGADGAALPMRVYGSGDATVVMLEGYPDPGFATHLGCTFMDMEWTISMAQILAASGFRVITHANRDPLPDAVALLKHLGAPAGIWAASGHGPIALRALGHARCGVFINPIVGDDVPDQPIFVVRSGKDETPDLNAGLDRFIAKALVEDKAITVVNYRGAPHAFDLHLDGATTALILQQAMAFLRVYLAA